MLRISKVERFRKKPWLQRIKDFLRNPLVAHMRNLSLCSTHHWFHQWPPAWLGSRSRNSHRWIPEGITTCHRGRQRARWWRGTVVPMVGGDGV